MVSPSTFHEEPRSPLGSRLAAAAIALFIVYIATVLGAVLPMRLLDAVWQLGFAGALINNAPMALVGLVLMHMAVRLEPGNPFLADRLSTCAHLARFTVVGFILLVPLQLLAVGQTLKVHQAVRSHQMDVAEQRIAKVRSAITSSKTIEQLQAELARMQVGTLTVRGNPKEGSSLSVIREKMLNSLEGSRSTLQSQFRNSNKGRIWELIQLSMQGTVSTIALAGGFAALAHRRGSAISLLEELRRNFGKLRWPSFRRQRNRDAHRLWKQP